MTGGVDGSGGGGGAVRVTLIEHSREPVWIALPTLLETASVNEATPSLRGVPAMTPPALKLVREPEINPQHQQIYDWADQGFTSRQIAQQLQKPYGEIELILALRPSDRRRNANG